MLNLKFQHHYNAMRALLNRAIVIVGSIGSFKPIEFSKFKYIESLSTYNIFLVKMVEI